jgi:hypothetical protein
MVCTCDATGEHPRRIARARETGETGKSSRSEIQGFLNFELRIAVFSHVSHFTRHGCGSAEFLSILLRLEPFDLSRHSIHGDALAVLQ